ncbi:MAG: autotransporter-associated beta strand repeat-containing protein [Lentisphaeria bacterium]|nr:autotransporter-associated beta strand repeat-containing protein [Lentisphaeria bacterium]
MSQHIRNQKSEISNGPARKETIMSPSTFSKSLATITLMIAALFTGVLGAKAATYTWIEKATGDQPWTDGTNWDTNGQFVSGSSNELMFFADITTQFTTNGTQTITSVPTTLSMNTLTLNGYAQNNANGFTILFDPASTWTIGDGTTSTINLNSKKHSFDQRSIFFKLPSLVLNAGTTTITTTSVNTGTNAGFHFTGSISGAAGGNGILKSGTSRIDFQASNSYTGTTEVTGGILRLSHANALPGGIGATGGTSALTLNGGVIELAAGDFMRNLGTGSDQFQITGGASGFSAVGADRVVTVNNDASQEIVWGSASFNQATLELNSTRFSTAIAGNDTTDSDLTISNKIDLNGATRNIKVDNKTVHLPGVIRNSNDTLAAGINKSGAGTLLLTAANTYDGATTISAGTVSIETSANAGVGGAIVFDGGTLQIRGTTLTQLSGLGHAATLNSNKTVGFDIQAAGNTFTADQVLNQGTGGLIKSGAGTLVLNQNNTFTGATTVSGGGTLVLDYSTNNDSKLANGAALNLSGSTIEVSGGSHGEVVNNTVMSLYYANSITRSSGTAVIDLNAITGFNNRNALSLSAGGIATTDTLNNATTGILGGWATVGSHLAINSTNAADGLITAYNGYTDFVSSGSVSTTNYQLLGAGSVSATQAMNTLRIENTEDDQTLNLGSNNLVMANYNGGNGGGVLLYAGGANNNYTITGTTGLLSPTNGNGQSLGINVYQGTLTLDVAIANGSSNFVKTGAGTLIMNKARTTYNGATYLLEGATRMAHESALGTGTVTVNAGAALELSNDITVGATKALSLNGVGVSNGGALRNYSGSNTYGGPITIGASGARINSDTATSLNLTGGVVTAYTRDVTFGGAGDTTVSTTGISGAGSVIKDGAGTLTLDADNTYTGATAVNGGTLLVSGNGTINQTSGVTIASGGTFRYNSSVAYTGGAITNNGGTIGGTGRIGATVTLDSTSDILAPGNSPGIQPYGTSQTWNSFTYQWETNDFIGTTAGTDFDQITIAGTLDLTGDTAGSYILDVLSLTASNATGDVPNFVEEDRSWDILTTTDGITGFNASYWSIDTGSFTSDPVWSGTWSLSATSNNLVLTYAKIPEPSTAILAGLGLMGFCFRRRRK